MNSESCAHCGLPVPLGRQVAEDVLAFCCDGCAAVHAILGATGLSRYYELRGADGPFPAAKTTNRRHEEFDSEAFRALHCRPLRDGLETLELDLEGVHCPACLWLVEKLPRVADGVLEARLQLARSRCRVVFDPERIAPSAIARALDQLGYPPHPARSLSGATERRRELRRGLVRIGVAWASALNVMLISVALYGGWLGDMDEGTARLLRVAAGVACLPALWAARELLASAWRSLKQRRLHVDLPVAVGILLGFAGSLLALVHGGEVYFDSVATLIALLLCGRLLQQHAQRAAVEASDIGEALLPLSAVVCEGEERKVTPLGDLCPGQLIQVGPGERIPVDGVVRDGDSELDCSLLTGESAPVAVGPGDEVHAGTTNLVGSLVLQARATGENTRVGRLSAAVGEQLTRRVPILRLADRLSGMFVAGVLGLATLTAVTWLFLDPARAIDHVVAMLIVTCPCALALATPLAVTVAVGRAARAGLLVKGGDALERLAAARTIVFDKTGTVTEGSMRMVSFEGDRDWAQRAAALEARSLHPIALAWLEAFPIEVDAAAVPTTGLPGGGLKALLDGHDVALGSPKSMALAGASWGESEEAELDRLRGQGHTPVMLAVDGAVVGVAGLADPLREEAPAVLRALQDRGLSIRLLSGDDEAVVAGVARELGLEAAQARGGASPEEKLEALRDAPHQVMVGDGVNDAAALAAAGVGVAVRGGTEACIEAADVSLVNPGLNGLLDLFEGVRTTLRTIRLGVGLSLLYNLFGAGLALSGLIHPLAAALLMPASSLSVVALAWWGPKFRSLP